jgi:hypothetical protein
VPAAEVLCRDRRQTDGPYRVAVLGALHANADRLAAVLAAVDEAQADVVWMLGGVLGVGPDAARVVDIVRGRGPQVLLAGPHDLRVAGGPPDAGLGEAGEAAAAHAAATLDADAVRWLSGLHRGLAYPRVSARAHVNVVCGTLDDPLRGTDEPTVAVRRVARVLSARKRRHGELWLSSAPGRPFAERTEPPADTSKENGGRRAIKDGQRRVIASGDWAIAPGAVGIAQTTGDPAAWWMLIEYRACTGGQRRITWNRVSVDPGPAAARVAAAGLPAECARAFDPHGTTARYAAR